MRKNKFFYKADSGAAGGGAPAAATPPANPFLTSLPEDVRAEPSLAVFKDVGSLAKGFVETKKKMGGMIALPPKDATPEQIQEWKEKHGQSLIDSRIIDAPPAEYTIPDIEGYHPDAEMVTKFTELAKKHHLPQAAVEELLAFDHARGQAMQGQVNIVTPEQADAEMKKEYGAEYPKMMENVNAAVAALNEEYPGLLNPDKMARTFVVEIDENGQPGKTYPLMKHNIVNGLLEQIGVLTTEDHAGGVGATPGGGRTESAVWSEIHEYQKRGGQHYDSYMKQEPYALKRVNELFEELAAITGKKDGTNG
jgi:hypothetical protein